MAYIFKLNSFDEVAAWYDKTKPVVSKHHTREQDVRPIGKRTRKWERVIKLDDNTYAFSCGGTADPVFHWGWKEWCDKYPLTKQEMCLNPIVWHKDKDGTETITIRNGRGDYQHNAVYSFLNRALPSDLWFRIDRNGRQYIYNRCQSQTVYLPKTKTAPKHVYYRYKSEMEKNPKADWAKRQFALCQLGDDGLSMRFKRASDGTFTLMDEAPKLMVERKRVKSDEKAPYREHIAGLRNWALAMWPLVKGQISWSFGNDICKAVNTVAEENKVSGYKKSWRTPMAESDPDLVREVLKDPDHPLRYGLGMGAVIVIHDAYHDWDRRTDLLDHMEEARAKEWNACMLRAFNRWINKLAGFDYAVKEEM